MHGAVTEGAAPYFSFYPGVVSVVSVLFFVFEMT